LASLTQALRKLADELDADEKRELEAAERARVDRLEARLERGGLSEEDSETLKRARALLDALDQEPDDDQPATRGGAGGSSNGSGSGGGSGDGDAPPPRTATRPGRKRGNAYDWEPDDSGAPRRLSTARVFSGDDEPDEIEYELVEDEPA
jgi:hypothetical protein